MKIVVAGSRGFNDYELLKQNLFEVIQKHKLFPNDVEIVSGGARGADRLGERFAKDYDYKLTIMNADWDTYGKSAGYRRNADMAKYGDIVVCFWDGVSKGTKHMIDLAEKHDCELLIVQY